MYCKTCGKEISEVQAICLGCGCEKGTGTKYCANCGAVLNVNAAVCLTCGLPADFMAKKSKVLSNADWCPDDKNALAAILLCFFLGTLGIHNFYLGEAKKGIFKIVMSLFVIGGILALIDFIKMLAGYYKIDADKLI